MLHPLDLTQAAVSLLRKDQTRPQLYQSAVYAVRSCALHDTGKLRSRLNLILKKIFLECGRDSDSFCHDVPAFPA